jgi:penicillin-binding protein 1C
MFSVFESLPRASWFPVPVDSLKTVETCAASGHVASPWCADRKTTLVSAVMAVRGVCPYCSPWLVSADGAWRVDADSAEKYGARLVPLFSLPPTMEWYFRRKEISYRPLPPFAPDSRPSSRAAFDIVMPSEGMSVYAPVELDGSPGEVVFEATCRDPGLVLHWHLDSTYLGSTRGFHQIAVRPGQGAHVLTVVDSTGASVSVRFVALNER